MAPAAALLLAAPLLLGARPAAAEADASSLMQRGMDRRGDADDRYPLNWGDNPLPSEMEHLRRVWEHFQGYFPLSRTWINQTRNTPIAVRASTADGPRPFQLAVDEAKLLCDRMHGCAGFTMRVHPEVPAPAAGMYDVHYATFLHACEIARCGCNDDDSGFSTERVHWFTFFRYDYCNAEFAGVHEYGVDRIVVNISAENMTWENREGHQTYANAADRRRRRRRRNPLGSTISNGNDGLYNDSQDADSGQNVSFEENTRNQGFKPQNQSENDGDFVGQRRTRLPVNVTEGYGRNVTRSYLDAQSEMVPEDVITYLRTMAAQAYMMNEKEAEELANGTLVQPSIEELYTLANDFADVTAAPTVERQRAFGQDEAKQTHHAKRHGKKKKKKAQWWNPRSWPISQRLRHLTADSDVDSADSAEREQLLNELESDKKKILKARKARMDAAKLEGLALEPKSRQLFEAEADGRGRSAEAWLESDEGRRSVDAARRRGEEIAKHKVIGAPDLSLC